MGFMMTELQIWLLVINAWEHPSGSEHIPCFCILWRVLVHHSAFELFLGLFR